METLTQGSVPRPALVARGKANRDSSKVLESKASLTLTLRSNRNVAAALQVALFMTWLGKLSLANGAACVSVFFVRWVYGDDRSVLINQHATQRECRSATIHTPHSVEQDGFGLEILGDNYCSLPIECDSDLMAQSL